MTARTTIAAIGMLLGAAACISLLMMQGPAQQTAIRRTESSTSRESKRDGLDAPREAPVKRQEVAGNGGETAAVTVTSTMPLDISHDSEGRIVLPRDQAIMLAKAHQAFGKVEEAAIRERVMGWRIKSRYQLDVPLERFTRDGVVLNSIEKAKLEEILNDHNPALEEIANMTIEVARASYARYLEEEMFRCVPAGSGEFEAVPSGGSSYVFDSVFDSAGWSFQFAFRSRDFPELEDHFRYIEELRARRYADVAGFLTGL